jgi:SAM-dependent methyltransferase
MGMSDIEKVIYNEGERLIPGITHDVKEAIRHKSSYSFFRKIIEYDISMKYMSNSVSILDFGCGVGYGSAMLAEIPDVSITGVDIFNDCILYAQERYRKSNINYRLIQSDYVKSMDEYDYIVSRGVIEHIDDGLEVAFKMRWKERLLFNVPYDESPGNSHHVLLGITEKDFERFTNVELYYEDLGGRTYDAATKPTKPNMITCICSNSRLPSVGIMNMTFPLPAWEERAI